MFKKFIVLLFLAFYMLLAVSCRPAIKEYSKTWLSLGTVCRVRILTSKPKKKGGRGFGKGICRADKT